MLYNRQVCGKPSDLKKKKKKPTNKQEEFKKA